MIDLYNTDAITSSFTFLAWRAEWRQVYKALSSEIKVRKLEIKNGFRAGEYMGREQNALRTMQSKATKMLDLRKLVKDKAASERARRFEEA